MKTKYKNIRDCVFITLLAILNAFNFNVFIFSNAFAPSGINGVATMIQYKLNLSLGYFSLIINIPLLIGAFFLLNRQYAFKTLNYVLVFSVSVVILKDLKFDVSNYVYHTDNGTSTVLAPIAGGAISGFVMGIVFMLGGSSGGTDVIASLLRRKRPYLNLVWLIFTLNAVVAVVSYFVYDYKFEPVICCLVYCYVSSNMTDLMLKGGKEAVKFEIVTTHPDEISEAIIKELKHSATLVKAEGMFSHGEKSLLICIVNKHQIVDFQRILSRFPDSFAYVTKVNETVGNFKEIRHIKESKLRNYHEKH